MNATQTAQLTLVAALGLTIQQAAGADDKTALHVELASVVAEVKAAVFAKQLYVLAGEDSGSFYLSESQRPLSASRAQVESELKKAIATGELSGMSGEDSGSVFLAHARSTGGTTAPGTLATASR